MNSNLVHSSAIELNSDERNLSEQRMFARLFTSAFCFRLKSITIIELHLCSCKFCIVGLLNRLVNDKMFWKLSCDSRHIVFAYCTISDDFIDVLKRFVIFCCDKHSWGIFIQSISERRFKSLTFVFDISLLLAIKLQIIIHTRIISMLSTRMNNDSCRLIENNPILIFIQNPGLNLI